jgi:hypothetical protein
VAATNAGMEADGRKAPMRSGSRSGRGQGEGCPMAKRERERENRVGTTTGGVGVSSDGEKVRWRRDDDRHEEKR